MLTMHFKPDYAVDNLRANNYICHFSVFQKIVSKALVLAMRKCRYPCLRKCSATAPLAASVA